MDHFDEDSIQPISSIQRGPPPPVVKAHPEDPVLRRLKKHKFCKAVIKCTVESPLRKRVSFCRYDPDLYVPRPQPQDAVKRTEDNWMDILDNLNHKNPRDCVAELVYFRNCLDSMGDCVQWLKNKPVRSGQEDKFLRKGLARGRLKEIHGTGEDDATCKKAYGYLQDTAKEGDKFVSNETVGLHVLDEYMLQSGVDLLQFFSALDNTKCGTLEWHKIAKALKKENVPLKTFQILQGITALKCDQGEGFDYQNFCQRMENFRKYKYRRLVSNSDDFCDDLVKSLEDKIRSPGGKMERKMSQHPETWRDIASKYLQSDSSPEPRPKAKACKYWPGALLDKIRPCYMPGDKQHPERRHPVFEIIHTETPVRRPPTRLQPFTRYTIYGYDKQI